MTAECWKNVYALKDGSQRVGPPCWSRASAVRHGAEASSISGARVLYRLKVRARLPAIFSEGRSPPAVG